MHVAWRKDLERLLTTFVAEHPGLCSGRMFGVPGAYAGRKLPPDAFEAAIQHGARPRRGTRTSGVSAVGFGEGKRPR